ncbi:MAG: DUF445 domain-containing protein [Bacteriovoracaceae bacterium]|nr:DUF445 domain-containing protein [Bacteriovoracaceae bacterium]
MTNALAALIVICGYISPVYQKQLLTVGFFALSGSVTNWLAVHMLFEKVPYLYGSGVIPTRFHDFKDGIKTLIMGQFFNHANTSTDQLIDYNGVVEAIDYDHLFANLLEVIVNSPFGGMLAMLGGSTALEPLKTPFVVKMKASIIEISQSASFKEAINKNEMVAKIEEVVHQRLEEMTPQMVKVIIQDMIAKHLGWLVVWGGVFGGVIGFMLSFA